MTDHDDLTCPTCEVMRRPVRLKPCRTCGFEDPGIAAADMDPADYKKFDAHRGHLLAEDYGIR